MVHFVKSQTGNHRDRLLRLFEVGVESCQARNILPALLPAGAPAGRNIVLGAGKAAADKTYECFVRVILIDPREESDNSD